MEPIRIRTRLESDTLVLPELRSLVGKTVDISVAEAPDDTLDSMLDDELHAECEADPSPPVTLEEVRQGLAGIPGSMADDFAAERDDR